MSDKTYTALLLVLMVGIFGFFMFRIGSYQKHEPVVPPKPAEATIKITEADGDVYWTKGINFNETRSCVIFVALPAGTHTVVCGNYRMEGLQSEHIQAS